MAEGRGLRERLVEIERRASSYPNEDTLRQDFVEAVNAFLGETGLHRKEVRAVLEERVIKGRTDARVGGIVFELKRPSVGIRAAIDDAKRRVREAGARMRREVWGVAYDGRKLAFIGGDGELIGSVRPVATGARMLQSWLISLGAEVATAEDFVNRLGGTEGVAPTAIDLLWRLFEGYRGRVGFIEEVFAVWRALYGVTTNLNEEGRRDLRRSAQGVGIPVRHGKEDEYLFVVETYLALLMKLLVARVAVQQGLADASSVERLVPESGSYVLGLRGLGGRVPGIEGVFEEDVFLWPADAITEAPEVARDLDDVIRRVASVVDDVDLVGASEDFLRQVYQRFLDPVTRRTLGEFYTSKELVQETLDAVGFEGQRGKRIADISCGSGTFLVEAIARILTKNGTGEGLLREIGNNVVGIDIHPFAVAMARVNYLIAIARLLPSEAPVNVPIYWTDSLTRLRERGRERRMAGARRPIAVPIAGLGTFTLPDPEEVRWDEFLEYVGDALNYLGRLGRGTVEKEAAWRQFRSRVSEERWGDWVVWEGPMKEFVGTIVERHNNNRDMRWLPLLRNALSVGRLVETCDYVVGNPPWVRSHNISADIRKRLFSDYEVCKEAGWRRGAKLGHGGRGFGRQVDYSIAFVERALEFLRGDPPGRVGYVITSKWMHALYGNALRKELVGNGRVVKLIDYSLQGRPLFEDATNYPLVLVAEKGWPEHDRKVEVTVAGPGGGRLEFGVLQRDLPMLGGDLESPWALVPAKVRQAFERMQGERRRRRLLGQVAGAAPRMGVKTAANEVFIVKHRRAVPGTPGEVMVQTEGYYSKGGEEGEKERFRARVEEKLLRPLVRGRDIEAWRYRVEDYMLWTHDDRTGEVRGKLPRQAREYFERHADRLRRRTDYKAGMPIWTIFRVSADKLGDKVAWQELSNELGAVYMPQKVVAGTGEKVALIPLQTAYLVPVSSEDAGNVLAGLFNSLPVRSYASSLAERARGGYFRYISWVLGMVPLPEDVERLLAGRVKKVPATLRRLWEISRLLHEDPNRGNRRELEEELDGEVGRLYGLTDEDMEALRGYFAFIRADGAPGLPSQEAEAE